jgi:hypothetical protein
MLKTFAFAAIAAIAAISTPAYAGLTINGLTINGLTINGLTINGLTINGLTINGRANGSAALQAVKITLPDSTILMLR